MERNFKQVENTINFYINEYENIMKSKEAEKEEEMNNKLKKNKKNRPFASKLYSKPQN